RHDLRRDRRAPARSGARRGGRRQGDCGAVMPSRRAPLLYSWRVRVTLAFVLLIACRPSASVERTMPVASLQSYRTVSLRVRSSTFASQGTAMMMESAVLGKLRERCGFEAVAAPGQPADVVLDLNITNKS